MTIFNTTRDFLIVLSIVVVGCSGPLTQAEKHDRAIRFYQKGRYEQDRGKTVSAVELYWKAIAMDSLLADAYCGIAETFALDEAYDRTDKVLTPVAVLFSQHNRFNYLLGEAGFRLGKINDAVIHLERVEAGDSSYADALFLLAQSYDKIGNVRKAAHIYKTLMDIPGLKRRDRIENAYDVFSAHRFPFVSYEQERLEIIGRKNAIDRSDLAFLLTVILELPSNNNITFKDLNDSDPLFRYAASAVGAEVMEILPDRKFRGGYVLKRRNLAHYAFGIVKRSGKKIEFNQTVWLDVPRSHVLFDEIAAIVSLGILKPFDEKRFGEDDTVSGTEAIQAIESLIPWMKSF
ncbi:tetratricopeptide repeat protein [bacterium]|nr:tetratricopeptide repeat protein [bacterium]